MLTPRGLGRIWWRSHVMVAFLCKHVHYNDVIIARHSVWNHQPHDCFLNRLFRHRSKKASKLRVTGLFAGNFPAQMASNAENVSIWWRHHEIWQHKPLSFYIQPISLNIFHRNSNSVEISFCSHFDPVKEIATNFAHFAELCSRGMCKMSPSECQLLDDDDIKWKHFPRYWPFVRGIHRSPVNSPHKGQWRGVLMFTLICTWTNGWVNNRYVGYLISHRTHYDVNVMEFHVQGVSKTVNPFKHLYFMNQSTHLQKIKLKLKA